MSNTFLQTVMFAVGNKTHDHVTRRLNEMGLTHQEVCADLYTYICENDTLPWKACEDNMVFRRVGESLGVLEKFTNKIVSDESFSDTDVAAAAMAVADVLVVLSNRLNAITSNGGSCSVTVNVISEINNANAFISRADSVNAREHDAMLAGQYLRHALDKIAKHKL